MSISNEQKQQVAELMSIILNDSEILFHANKVNQKTVEYAEEIVVSFHFCNKATAALLAGIQCIPKSRNIYGWLLSCIPAVSRLVRANRQIFYSSMMCNIGIQAHKSALKATML